MGCGGECKVDGGDAQRGDDAGNECTAHCEGRGDGETECGSEGKGESAVRNGCRDRETESRDREITGAQRRTQNLRDCEGNQRCEGKDRGGHGEGKGQSESERERKGKGQSEGECAQGMDGVQ